LKTVNLQLLSYMIKLPLKQLTNYLSIVYVVFVLCSCGSDTNPNTDLEVFRYNEHKNIGSLDPAFSKDISDIWATNQLFNGLVQMDGHLNIQPSIAKNWTISPDALTYAFSLRNDVYFHKHKLFGKDSTRIVTATDFEYSFNRLFEIQLKQPFPAFLGLLTMKYCSVVPKEIVEFYGSDFRSNPIGTGPFKFKRWEENLKLVLRKNPIYFEKDSLGDPLPYLEAIS